MLPFYSSHRFLSREQKPCWFSETKRNRTQFSEAAVRSRKNPHPSGDFLKSLKCFKHCSQNWKSLFTTEVDKLKVNINKIDACQRLFSIFFPTTGWKYKRNIIVWQQRYAALLKWARLMLMLEPRKLDIHIKVTFHALGYQPHRLTVNENFFLTVPTSRSFETQVQTLRMRTSCDTNPFKITFPTLLFAKKKTTLRQRLNTSLYKKLFLFCVWKKQ